MIDVIKVTVNIDVPDNKAATAFYTKALDCEKIRDQPPNLTVLQVAGLDIYLSEVAEGTQPLRQNSAIRSYDRHWTPVHLDFIVDDVPLCVERIVKAGGLHEGGDSGDWGEIAFCSDPFGNGFCVIKE